MKSLLEYVQIVLQEYTDKFVSDTVSRFRREDPEISLDDAQIRKVIEFFESKKDNPRVKSFKVDPSGRPVGDDIGRYTWQELTSVIKKYFPSKELFDQQEVVEVPEEFVKLHDANGVEVYSGVTREQCIRVRAFLAQETGRTYTFCIGEPVANRNYFMHYRGQTGRNPVFYFVLDRNKPVSDINHVFVVHALLDGSYGITRSENRQDENTTWEEIVKICPELANVRQIFASKPLTAAEKKQMELTRVDDNAFKNFSYDEIKDYIDAKFGLSAEQMRYTFSVSKDLFNYYANVTNGIIPPKDLWDSLPGATKKSIEKRMTSELVPLYKVVLMGERSIDGDIIFGSAGWHNAPVNPDNFDFSVLGDNLTVKGKMTIGGWSSPNESGSKLTKLPKNLTVLGDLTIRNCKDLTNLPENLRVGRGLYVEGVPLVEYPDNAQVGGSIELKKTKISKFPDSLHVKGSFVLSGEGISSLPRNLRVDKSFRLGSGKVTSLPENLSVGKNLNLRGLKTQTLPNDMKVTGDFKPPSSLRKLPLNLQIDGLLDLKDSNYIKEIPEGTKTKKIRPPKGDAITLPASLENVSLEVRGYYAGFPKGIKNFANIIYAPFGRLKTDIVPDGTKVDKNLFVRELSAIGNNVSAGVLGSVGYIYVNIDNNGTINFPQNLSVKTLNCAISLPYDAVKALVSYASIKDPKSESMKSLIEKGIIKINFNGLKVEKFSSSSSGGGYYNYSLSSADLKKIYENSTEGKSAANEAVLRRFVRSLLEGIRKV